jgi:hypothetical protein
MQLLENLQLESIEYGLLLLSGDAVQGLEGLHVYLKNVSSFDGF